MKLLFYSNIIVGCCRL